MMSLEAPASSQAGSESLRSGLEAGASGTPELKLQVQKHILCKLLF